MSDSNTTVIIDDATGRQIASVEDAKSGGATILRRQAADKWLADNPELALAPAAESSSKRGRKAAEPSEDKAAAPAEDK